MTNKNTKLVYINQTLGMGGAEVFMSDLLSGLQSEGFEVFAYTTSQDFLDLLREKGVVGERLLVVLDIIGDWKGLAKAAVLSPFGLWQYFQVVRKNRDADVFLFSGFVEKLVCSWLGYFFGVRSVWIEFGPLEPIFSKFLSLPKLLYFASKHLPEKIIVPSENTLDHLRTVGISPEKLVLIPCGRPDVAQNLKTSQSVAGQKIVCVSRLEPGKGQDLLVKAFKIVRQKLPDSKLTIVGEGDFIEKIEGLVDYYHLEESVELAGRVPDSLKVMAEAAVCVFPSVWKHEGFGLVTIEAMALGKPVVAFDHGPGNEIVVDGKTGLLAKSGDVHDLAKKIIRVLEDRDLAESLGRAGRKRFLEKYQIEKCVREYETLLHPIL